MYGGSRAPRFAVRQGGRVYFIKESTSSLLDFFVEATYELDTIQVLGYYYGLALGPAGSILVNGTTQDDRAIYLVRFENQAPETTLVTKEIMYPTGLAVLDEDTILVSDDWTAKVYRVSLDGKIETYAGSSRGSADGTASTAQFKNPRGIVVSGSGTVYIQDESRIRSISPDRMVSTLSWTGDDNSTFSSAYGGKIADDGAGGLYAGMGGAIYHLSRSGTYRQLVQALPSVDDLVWDSSGYLLATHTKGCSISRITTDGRVFPYLVFKNCRPEAGG